MRQYEYRVVALGTSFSDVERNVGRMREQGFTLLSTYVDRNRATTRQEPTVVGVFETWTKVRRR
jgi:hypothetical protein